MLSLLDNTLEKVTVHIISDNTLSASNRKKLVEIVQKYNQQIEFYNVDELATDWIKKISDSQIIFCNESENQKLITEIELTDKTVILIGSEGGFSNNELKTLKDIGAISVSLGKNILRVDTAAISALSIVKSLKMI